MSTVYHPANFHRMTLAERAYAQSPGQGMPQQPYGRLMCVRCLDTKPTKGGQLKPFFLCAECKAK